MTQTSSFSADDVWGEMGLMDDAVKSNTDYANTIFDKYTSYTENQNSNTPDYTQGKYPTDLSSQSSSGNTSLDKENKTIKNIEFYGLNSIPPQELLEKCR